ncbi:MAG TPA: alpha-amylase family glycosyl hydrolase, partial [Povalibacter sp.]|nr:alpha-amylase family glycosyl hydrolase [Povalibacter sp.]
LGDFVGLDDLMTENPRVVSGFIDIYGYWIDEFNVDGFRIDTAKHVNPEFWQAFVPAMLSRAQARGIPNFHIFGEVYTSEVDPALLARATRVSQLPAVIDFAFRAAVLRTLAGDAGTETLAHLFDADVLYQAGTATAAILPTFVSNHDQGRFGYYARRAFPAASDDEILKRSILAQAMMFTLRGVPVVYAGDEQGFAGDGDDQNAREDMFASQVASYNDNRLIGTDATTARSSFNQDHPLFKAISELSRLRREQPALRRGEQLIRNFGDKPGLFAVSRIDPQTGAEIIVAFNTSTVPLSTNVTIDARSTQFTALHGVCAPDAWAPGSYKVQLAPLDYVVCAAVGEGRKTIPQRPTPGEASR